MYTVDEGITMYITCMCSKWILKGLSFLKSVTTIAGQKTFPEKAEVHCKHAENLANANVHVHV